MSTPLPDITGGQHRLDSQASSSEPVLIAHTVTTLLYALAGAGWLVIPDVKIAAIGTAAAVLLGLAAAFMARARVSPTGRITWTSIQGAIRAMVFEEVDRLIAAAPTAAAGGIADQIAELHDRIDLIAAPPAPLAPVSGRYDDPATEAFPAQPPAPAAGPSGTTALPVITPADRSSP